MNGVYLLSTHTYGCTRVYKLSLTVVLSLSKNMVWSGLDLWTAQYFPPLRTQELIGAGDDLPLGETKKISKITRT